LLEVGVGTGKNMPYWPREVDLTAIDLTPAMVARARGRGAQLGLQAEILEGDVQGLRFSDDSFDAAAATFVFCSVPDPVLGLRELVRVVQPGGSIFLMEHVRSQNPLVGKFMDLVNPVVRSLMGPNINRDTVANVKRADLSIINVEDLDRGGIFKIIHARNAGPSAGGSS
jgi:ubiquinone/menaquinone biosynthesis C-methylase UbiE